mmetsp:Transcript_1715/g.3036  ORF Transcript_1715/g.3036 Transcript_1715/m.3036 type:complete len:104 (-) Transcript_1715:55-366(-)
MLAISRGNISNVVGGAIAASSLVFNFFSLNKASIYFGALIIISLVVAFLIGNLFLGSILYTMGPVQQQGYLFYACRTRRSGKDSSFTSSEAEAMEEGDKLQGS